MKKTKINLKKPNTDVVFKNIGFTFWSVLIGMGGVGIFFTEELILWISGRVDAIGYLGFSGLTLLLELLVLPTGPDLTLVFGMLVFDPWISFGLTILFTNLALLIAYPVGKRIGAPGIRKLVGEATFQKMKTSSLQGKLFLTAGALTPVPYIPYLAGLWELSLKETLLFIALPRTFRYGLVFTLTHFFSDFILGVFPLTQP